MHYFRAKIGPKKISELAWELSREKRNEPSRIGHQMPLLVTQKRQPLSARDVERVGGSILHKRILSPGSYSSALLSFVGITILLARPLTTLF